METETANAAVATEGPRQTPAPVKLLGMTGALAAVLLVLLGLFILPALKSGPHDLAVGVVGAPEAAQVVADALKAEGDDVFAVEAFDDAAALAAAVEAREVTGGFVVTASGLETVVASAGSTAISGTLTATGSALASAMDVDSSVTDVVPLPHADPTGIGIGGLAFPLVFGGIVPVVAFRAMFPHSALWRIGGLVTFAAVGGAVVAAVLQFWFGSVEDAFWPVTGAMALGIAALAFPLAGLQQAFGAKGFTAGAMAMMFLGNPLAGISTTGAWLPTGVGLLGQILPPGAAGTLVRSAAYFDGAGGLIAALTLTLWVFVGAVLLLFSAEEKAGENTVEPQAA